MNLADIAAMGARPTALLVALACPSDTRLSFVEELADGLRAACDALAPGCAVDGGDLTVSDTLTIAVTALGDLDGRAPVLRSGRARRRRGRGRGASSGSPAAGSRCCSRDSAMPTGTPRPRRPRRRSTPASARPSRRSCVPRRRSRSGAVAADAGATAMMDVSDGLALDASRMADGIRRHDRPRRVRARRRPGRALAGGEDHALLATFPAGRRPAGRVPPIGTCASGGATAVLVDGRPYDGRGAGTRTATGTRSGGVIAARSPPQRGVAVALVARSCTSPSGSVGLRRARRALHDDGAPRSEQRHQQRRGRASARRSARSYGGSRKTRSNGPRGDAGRLHGGSRCTRDRGTRPDGLRHLAPRCARRRRPPRGASRRDRRCRPAAERLEPQRARSRVQIEHAAPASASADSSAPKSDSRTRSLVGRVPASGTSSASEPARPAMMRVTRPP